MLDAPATPETVARTVRDAVADVMAQRGLPAVEPAPEARLADTLGLKSMDLAQIVLELEDALEIDPFADISITSIRTVGDLANAYLAGLGLTEAPAAADLSAEMDAARARRTDRRR